MEQNQGGRFEKGGNKMERFQKHAFTHFLELQNKDPYRTLISSSHQPSVLQCARYYKGLNEAMKGNKEKRLEREMKRK